MTELRCQTTAALRPLSFPSCKLAVSFGGVVSRGWRGPRQGRRHRVLVVTGVDIVKKSAFIVTACSP